MTKLERMQRDYELRLAKQRKNRKNWTMGFNIIISPSVKDGLKDYIDYTMDNRAWKNKTNRNKSKQCTNHI